ncbi:hypothetical protein KM043_017415 [Ampulex compressa]|nr:hypothetical protein KM043_017415 [Ampulex compressa]
MGQAWCKEKTSKAQDSKSPLDRVFVRCAHRIYPGLKEEGSVLGGATQRVTSSEIGYAGSPPREVLARGRSIDSVDRPFHPSDWVDVNLEVPSTPRASSVLTNLTVDTSLYPATTPTSSCSNLKDVTPVPPPRRRKRNRGRPLPPKPDEIVENGTGNARRRENGDEPFYSSVKSPMTSGDEQEADEENEDAKKFPSFHEDSKQEPRRTKEIYEHKVNGTGRIISSDVVSGRVSEEKRSSGHRRRAQDSEEYEKFARNQLAKDSSTPNRQDRANFGDRQLEDSSRSANARPKNYSTVSLPNYDELDVDAGRRAKEESTPGDKTKFRRPVRCSTGSLPAESFLSPFSEKTSVCLEDYIPRRDVPGNLPSYQVLDELHCSANGVADFVKYDSSKLEDWDLSDVGNCESNQRRRPSTESSPVSPGAERQSCRDEDVVDFSRRAQDQEGGRKFQDRAEISSQSNPRVAAFLQKPEAFGKTPSPIFDGARDSGISALVGETAVSQRRYFEPPTMANCKNSATCYSGTSPTSREPFFLDETKHRLALDTIGGSSDNEGSMGTQDRSMQSRMIFRRSLSNESEPYEDLYEPKELRSEDGKVVRTISEESLPREMLEEVAEEDFFEEKLAKDVHNELKRSSEEQLCTDRTSARNSESRIQADVLDKERSNIDLNPTIRSLTELSDAEGRGELEPALRSPESRIRKEDLEHLGVDPRVERFADRARDGSEVEAAPSGSMQSAKAEVFDKDHSALLKILRREERVKEDDSNLSTDLTIGKSKEEAEAQLWSFDSRMKTDLPDREHSVFSKSSIIETKDLTTSNSIKGPKRSNEEENATSKTPPPSPEPRIKAEIMDNEHLALLKAMKEEAAEGSNLSSMTPSLTELEAALSDMLEREDQHEEAPARKPEDDAPSKPLEGPIEPEIVPVEKDQNRESLIGGVKGESSLVGEFAEPRTLSSSPMQTIEDKSSSMKGRKVSFCAWEETRMVESDMRNGRDSFSLSDDKNLGSEEDSSGPMFDEISSMSSRQMQVKGESRYEGRSAMLPTNPPPEKPGRLQRNLVDLPENAEVPTPPRRRNKGSFGIVKRDIEPAQNGSARAETGTDDRLI